MAAQGTDEVAASRSGIIGKLTIQDLVNLTLSQGRAWGTITGDITNQADLQAAFVQTGAVNQYVGGHKIFAGLTGFSDGRNFTPQHPIHLESQTPSNNARQAGIALGSDIESKYALISGYRGSYSGAMGVVIDVLNNNVVLEAMKILHNGNVGIGTDEPLTILDVGAHGTRDGDITMRSASGSTNSELSSLLWNMNVAGGVSDSHVAKIVALSKQSTSNRNELAFHVGAWNNDKNAGDVKMRILDNGYVGIGTSPTEKLEVDGTARVSSLKVQNGRWTTNGDDVFINGNGDHLYLRPTLGTSSNQVVMRSNGELWQYDGSSVIKNVFRTAGNSYINGGNFGIGTTNPTEKLDVNGNARVRNIPSTSGGNSYIILPNDVGRFEKQTINEGVVKIIASDDISTKPTVSGFVKNVAQYFEYNAGSLIFDKGRTQWPYNQVGIDNEIVDPSNFNFLENPVLGKVTTWVIEFEYTGKTATSDFHGLTIGLMNPFDDEVYAEERILPAGTATTPTIDFGGGDKRPLYGRVVLHTICDSSSIGTGYKLFGSFSANDPSLTVVIQSVTRIDNQKYIR